MSFKRTRIDSRSAFRIVFTLALLLATVEAINLFTGRSLNQFGLVPRNPDALLGIATAPFLHGSLWHFFSNIFPFVVFAFLLLQHGLIRFVLVSLCCIVVAGTLVWALARPAIHVGASGLIYGYFGYLVLAGILSREFKLLLISIFVGISYGGLVFGILPGMPWVSWESHLFGFVTGLGCACVWGRDKGSTQYS